MTLYRHAPTRADLLAMAWGQVLDQHTWPERDLPWRHLLHQYASALWDLLATYPGAVTEPSTAVMPERMVHLFDDLAVALIDQGFAAADAVLAVDTVIDLAIDHRRASRTSRNPPRVRAPRCCKTGSANCGRQTTLTHNHASKHARRCATPSRRRHATGSTASSNSPWTAWPRVAEPMVLRGAATTISATRAASMLRAETGSAAYARCPASREIRLEELRAALQCGSRPVPATWTDLVRSGPLPV